MRRHSVPAARDGRDRVLAEDARVLAGGDEVRVPAGGCVRTLSFTCINMYVYIYMWLDICAALRSVRGVLLGQLEVLKGARG